jgi:hypothetical protein
MEDAVMSSKTVCSPLAACVALVAMFSVACAWTGRPSTAERAEATADNVPQIASKSDPVWRTRQIDVVKASPNDQWVADQHRLIASKSSQLVKSNEDVNAPPIGHQTLARRLRQIASEGLRVGMTIEEVSSVLIDQSGLSLLNVDRSGAHARLRYGMGSRVMGAPTNPNQPVILVIYRRQSDIGNGEYGVERWKVEAPPPE